MLSGVHNDDDASAGGQLLADIKAVFIARNAERISTDDLLKTLCAMEERPWADLTKGRPMTARSLANLLRPFGLAPRKMRIGDEPQRGYERSDFKDAFERYLPSESDVPASFPIVRG